jgi:hypothetical protein
MGILCLSCWALAGLMIRSFDGLPLPYFTNLVLVLSGWIPLLPLPWVIYSAILSFRRDLSARAVFIFAGTIAFAMTAVICGAAFAGALPFVRLSS